VILRRYLQRWFTKRSEGDKALFDAVKNVTGRAPYNIRLYRLAMKHSSMAEVNDKGIRESNERLEYLGDAILGAIVAEYLFKKFPYKDEGFLTEIRSRIVNRESLNRLSIKIGLSQLVEFDGRNRRSQSHKSVFGDAMEAFIGALYLDRGYAFTKKFIIRKLIMHHYDLGELVETTINFKSAVIEWCQKHNKEINFVVDQINTSRNKKQFKTIIMIDNQAVAEGFGYSKKKAEQDAARKACESLDIS